MANPLLAGAYRSEGWTSADVRATARDVTYEFIVQGGIIAHGATAAASAHLCDARLDARESQAGRASANALRVTSADTRPTFVGGGDIPVTVASHFAIAPSARLDIFRREPLPGTFVCSSPRRCSPRLSAAEGFGKQEFGGAPSNSALTNDTHSISCRFESSL